MFGRKMIYDESGATLEYVVRSQNFQIKGFVHHSMNRPGHTPDGDMGSGYLHGGKTWLVMNVDRHDGLTDSPTLDQVGMVHPEIMPNWSTR
jgi:hypothetical protein